MTAFVMRLTGLPQPQAYALQERYHDDYGATVVGLVRHHGVNAQAFLDEVHDVDLSEIDNDVPLQRLIAAYPGQSVVYTNGAASYAKRVLTRLGVIDQIAAAIAIDDIALVPKPQPESFKKMAAIAGIDLRDSVMFEDSPRNLDTAAAFGCATVLVGAARPTNPVDFHTPHLHEFLHEVLHSHD